jgi:hypothetical protein
VRWLEQRVLLLVGHKGLRARGEFSAACTHHHEVVLLRQGPVGVDAGRVWTQVTLLLVGFCELALLHRTCHCIPRTLCHWRSHLSLAGTDLVYRREVKDSAVKENHAGLRYWVDRSRWRSRRPCLFGERASRRIHLHRRYCRLPWS